MDTTISRRAVLKAAPAIAAAALPAVAEPMSEIEQLSRQWIAAWAVNCETDDEQDRHHDEVLAPLMHRIASLPATTPRDMLWKIHVDSRAGDFGLEDETHAEISRMLGLDAGAELPGQEV